MWLAMFSITGASDTGLWLLSAVDVLCKTTAVLLMASLTVWLLRERSAATRHSVWSMAIAGALVVPLGPV